MIPTIFVLILLGPQAFDLTGPLPREPYDREAKAYVFEEMQHCKIAATAMYRAKEVLDAYCVEIKR